MPRPPETDRTTPHPRPERPPRLAVSEVCLVTHAERRGVGIVSTINRNGLFLRTLEVLPHRTVVGLEFGLRDRVHAFALEGEVVFLNSPEVFDPRLHIGMGIRFLQPDPRLTLALGRLVAEA